MKKLVIPVIVIALLIVSFNVISYQYRYEFRDWAVGYEAEASGLQHQTLFINGLDVAYYDSHPSNTADKKLETIVMLHGFGGSKENWLRYAKFFTDRYRVLALDLKGHGENKRDLTASYHIADQVAYVQDFAKQLGVEKFHVVGNSMGGAISSLYAARHPEQILSVVLISPAGVHDVPSGLDEALEQGRNPLIVKTEDDFAKLLDFVMVEKPFIPSAIAAVEAETAVSRLEINQKIFGDIRADLERHFENEFSKVQAPSLIIWGDQDLAINVANIDKYAELLSGAKKEVFQGIGHVAMIEVPEYTAKKALGFMHAQK